MRRLAGALKVRPAELFETIALAELEDDLAVEALGDFQGAAAGLAKRGITPYRVTSDAVELSGLVKGQRILIDSTAPIEQALPGTVVAYRATRPDKTEAFILRVFMPPQTLWTNRKGTNVALNLADDIIPLAYLGCVLKE